MDWFSYNCFVREVEKYIPRNNSVFKAVPMCNALGHPETVQHVHPNIEVIFLPPNTTSLIQLIDQRIIATSNSYYTRLTFSYLLDMMENNDSLTMRECCSCRTCLPRLCHFWKRSSNSMDTGGIVVRCF